MGNINQHGGSPAACGNAVPDPLNEIETLIRARYPILYIVSWEEERVEHGLIRVAKKLGKNAFSWSITRGLVPAGASLQSKKVLTEGTADPVSGLREVMERMDPAIYIFKDFHPYLTNPEIIRHLRDLAMQLRRSPKTLIFLSSRLRMPPELEKVITVMDMPLPSRAELEAFLSELEAEVKESGKIKFSLDGEARERLVKALGGLTLEEAENVLAKSTVLRSALDEGALPSVLAEKKQIIRKSGVLEYLEYEEGMEKVGGLKSLKDWIKRRSLAFTDKARNFGLPAPKGLLLIGVQGCGKSLCAKSVSAAWKQPLLRLDVSRIFSSLVGSSESNLRQAVNVAESVAPAVLWVDEIDKAFAGVQSSTFSDSGTTARVFGGFISWMQEKTSPVFVIATANDITNLPPELMRKGRFDEIFFVDLPGEPERRDIFGIHLRLRGRDPKAFNLEELAAASAGFSGAEIEQAVISALYTAFDAGRDISNTDVLGALRETVPLSKTMAEKIEEMRRWAKGRARPAA